MSILLSFVFQCVGLQQLNSPFIFRIVVVACSTGLYFFTLQYYSSNNCTPFYSGAQQFNNSKAKRILNPSQLVSSTGATGLLYKLVLL